MFGAWPTSLTCGIMKLDILRGRSEVTGHVFVSYSREDRVYVDKLAAKLRSEGIDVWYDDSIEHGERFDKVINERIDACHVYLVVMSRSSDQSHWVHGELGRARSRSKPILPLLLDGESFTSLNPMHLEDVTGGRMPSQKFIEKLKQLIRDAESKPPPPTFSGRIVNTLKGHSNESVRSVAWSPDGLKIALARPDGSTSIWTPSDSASTSVLDGHGGAVRSVAWSPDGAVIATASADRTVRIWDPVKRSTLKTLRGHRDEILSVAWSPDGRQLATASSDDTVQVWNRETGQSLFALKSHGTGIRSAAWSFDGQHLATANDDNTVRIFKAKTGDLHLDPLHGHEGWVHCVAWSPDGRRLATGSGDHTARIWSSGGQEERTLSGHENSLWAVAWSPDSKYLATASGDKTVRIWEISKTGSAAPFILDEHRDSVWSVDWAPDGKRVVVSSGDGDVHIWEVWQET